PSVALRACPTRRSSDLRVLEQIEQLANPRARNGKKSPSQEQLQLKNTLLSVLGEVRDESSKDAPVRIVLEPKSRTVDKDTFINRSEEHTSELQSRFDLV